MDAQPGKSQYPLKAKYDCLESPRNPFPKVNLHQNVTKCLEYYHDYSTERCLQVFEKRFDNKLGFKGGNMTKDGTFNPQDPKYFTVYGNLTKDLLEQRNADAKAAQIQAFEERSGISLQVSLNQASIVITDDTIEEYLCSQTWMYFYSNPYDDSLMVQGKPQEDITVGAFCEVFNFYDSVEEK